MRLWSPFWTFLVYPHLSVPTSGSQTTPDSGPTELEVLLLPPPPPKHPGSLFLPETTHQTHPLAFKHCQHPGHSPRPWRAAPHTPAGKSGGQQVNHQTPGPLLPRLGHVSPTRELGGMKHALPDPLPQSLVFNQICVIREPGKALRMATGCHLAPSQVSLALILLHREKGYLLRTGPPDPGFP